MLDRREIVLVEHLAHAIKIVFDGVSAGARRVVVFELHRAYCQISGARTGAIIVADDIYFESAQVCRTAPSVIESIAKMDDPIRTAFVDTGP